MEDISSLEIELESLKSVSFVKGEDGVDTLKLSKSSSGIEVAITGETDQIQGWPWGNIKSYTIIK